jgi:hypothetical protein
MENLTESQKSMLKNLALLGAFYFGVRSANKLIRYAVIVGIGAVLIKSYRESGQGVAGLGMKIDPHMAIDMLFPEMTDEKKSYAKLAVSELMRGMFPQNSPVQVGSL